MKVTEVFPVTVFKTRIDSNEILKNYLVEPILENLDDLVIPEDWTTNKIKTSFSGEPVGREVIEKHKSLLEKNYRRCIDEFFDLEYDCRFTNIWYNVYQDGEYQEFHDHLGTTINPIHFAFIHFLSYDKEEHQPPEFLDPLKFVRHSSLELLTNRCGEVYVPDIEEGDLLMFPSYLQHCVPPGKKTNKPRITISFNITVTQYGDEERRY